MEGEQLPLLALPYTPVGETEGEVLTKRDRAIRYAERKRAKAYTTADRRLAKTTKQQQLKAGERIAELRLEAERAAQIERLNKQGPPENASPGGKWFWRKYTVPTTVLCCIPWSESATAVAYRAPNGQVFTELGTLV